MSYRRRNLREGLVSTGDAALITEFNQMTITSWCRTGKLKCYVTPGGHYRLRLCDVCRYIDENYEFYDMSEEGSIDKLRESLEGEKWWYHPYISGICRGKSNRFHGRHNQYIAI